MVDSLERTWKRDGLCAGLTLWSNLIGCGSEPAQTTEPRESRPNVTDIARDEAMPSRDAGPVAASPPLDLPDAASAPVSCDPAGDGGCDAVARCEVDCTRFVDAEARLTILSEDIARLATPEERRDVRYLDLSGYANAGHDERALSSYRAALAFLLNSLSSAVTVRPLLAVDDQKLLFRIRLSDYGWSASTWERIASFYPYEVRYDPSSRRFPVTEAYAERLRSETGSSTPCLQADWLLARASRPPLYYDVLELPADEAQLAAQLGVDLAGDLAARRAQRAGFVRSGEARFNRVIERHASLRGALWLAHDFASGAGTGNVLVHPLDFQAQSRQLAFHLPNGLLGFMMVDALGSRLERGPSMYLQDPGARDLSMEAGLSCLGCHADRGIVPARDEVRAAASLTAADPALLAAVQGLYPEPGVLEPLVAQDQERHQRALRECQADDFQGSDLHRLDRTYQRLLSLRDVAGILGVPPTALIEALDETPRIFPNDVLALRRIDARLARAGFDAVFPDLVVALGLGQVTRRP